MRAITVRQPWASLIAEGNKEFETRGYRPRSVKVGERLAIHAGASLADLHRVGSYPFVKHCLPPTLPLGRIIATAVLFDVVRCDWDFRSPLSLFEEKAGDFSDGRFAWQLTDVRPLSVPVPCRGALGLWLVPDDIAARIEGDSHE